MALFRTDGPAAEPVTLADLKAHLRLESDGEDDLIAGLIGAAREDFEATTGTVLVEQSWRLTLDRWPASHMVLLRRCPVREVVSVTTYGQDGAAAILDPAACLLDAHAQPARLLFSQTPATGAAMNGIEIDFTAGYGETGADVPDLAKRAVTLLAAHWFEFRAAFGPESQPVSYPRGYRTIIAPFMQRRIA